MSGLTKIFKKYDQWLSEEKSKHIQASYLATEKRKEAEALERDALVAHGAVLALSSVIEELKEAKLWPEEEEDETVHRPGTRRPGQRGNVPRDGGEEHNT